MKLQNNSKEMKTSVETFVIEETSELIYDNEKLDKWNKLVGELGLKGQEKISVPTKSPIPFMNIKSSMKNVFETLCPRKVDVSEYDVTPIPVEILDLVALSVNEDYFTKIQIWYDDKSPDPLCIGVLGRFIIHEKGSHKQVGEDEFKTKKEVIDFISENKMKNVEPYDYSWNNATYYLLGKWADVKHSFEELKKMATERYIAEKGNDYRKSIVVANRGLDDLETEAFDKFN